jgi:hypothetical protein
VSLATAYASLEALYPAAVLMGLLFGSHWSLVPAICSDLFGARAPLTLSAPGRARCALGCV